MSNTETKDGSRRDFLRGLAAGGVVGVLGMMGVYSYGPWTKKHFPKTASKNIDIGQCSRARVVKNYETSWFKK
jgi:7,8-dihydropterin-6-yl-methyl-4-(beta-D-ribofuranosyl)aminobenzene 5'-phosphate synthase